MDTEINEQVEVLAVFKKGLVFPKLLRWNGRVYKVEELNMRHQAHDGKALIHYFSVSDKTNNFKLAFNTQSLNWTLEQVYSEG